MNDSVALNDAKQGYVESVLTALDHYRETTAARQATLSAAEEATAWLSAQSLSGLAEETLVSRMAMANMTLAQSANDANLTYEKARDAAIAVNALADAHAAAAQGQSDAAAGVTYQISLADAQESLALAQASAGLAYSLVEITAAQARDDSIAGALAALTAGLDNAESAYATDMNGAESNWKGLVEAAQGAFGTSLSAADEAMNTSLITINTNWNSALAAAMTTLLNGQAAADAGYNNALAGALGDWVGAEAGAVQTAAQAYEGAGYQEVTDVLGERYDTLVLDAASAAVEFTDDWGDAWIGNPGRGWNYASMVEVEATVAANMVTSGYDTDVGDGYNALFVSMAFFSEVDGGNAAAQGGLAGAIAGYTTLVNGADSTFAADAATANDGYLNGLAGTAGVSDEESGYLVSLHNAGTSQTTALGSANSAYLDALASAMATLRNSQAGIDAVLTTALGNDLYAQASADAVAGKALGGSLGTAESVMAVSLATLDHSLQTLQASAQGAMYVSASGVSGMWGANVSFVMADSAGNKTYMDVINQQNHDFNNTLVAQDNQVALAKALLLDISNAASTAALASINANMSFQVEFAKALKTRMHSLDTALIGQVTALAASDTAFSGVTVASLGSMSWERSTWNFLWGVVSSLPIIGRIVQTPLFAQLTDYSVDTTSAAFRDGAIAGMIAQVILGPMLALTCLPSYIGLAGAVYEDLNLVQAVWSAGEAVIDISQTGHVTWSDALSITLAVIAVYGKFGKVLGLRPSCFTAGTQVVVDTEGDSDDPVLSRYCDEKGIAIKKRVRYITKNIEELKEGDLVLCINENDPSGPLVFRKVGKVFRRTTFHLLHVQLLSSNGHEQTLSTTNEHGVYALGKGFIPAGKLTPGDHFMESQAGEMALVLQTRLEKLTEGLEVYNFSVDDAHTYFVRQQGSDAEPVWVHNSYGDSGEQLELFGGGSDEGIPSEEIAAAEANIGEVPAGKTIAADALGNRALSGWKSVDGFVQGTDEAAALGEEMGSPFESDWRDADYDGQYNASHAEAQLSTVSEGPIAVSRSMCSSCQGYFQQLAINRGDWQVVADPEAIWFFGPDGTVGIVPR